MTKLTDYNPFDHLLVEDELSQYLTEAYEDEDPAVFVVALGHAIKHQGVAQVAEATGLNRESLYKVINGQVQPKWHAIHRLMHALGYACPSQHRLYQKPRFVTSVQVLK